MRPRILRRSSFVLALVLALAFAPVALAQIARGNIYGTVADPTGGVLPGATVTLSGAFGTRSTTSDSQGEFRFLNVDQGTHTLTVKLMGFAEQVRNVVLRTGENVELHFSLQVAGLEEIVTITAESPVVDAKKVGTATVIARDELSKIPSSRDPWALMRTIPGVMVDRVNIAGSESGQQSTFTSKGSDPKDAVWAIDGVVITDMQALGSSPGYYTYDTFEEVNFTTGGSSVSVATGGLGINMASKRGTNELRGGVGGYFTHDDLQWGNLPASLQGDPRLQGNDKADHTEQIADWSADVGGPIVHDKLWFYGSFGENDIRIKNLNQQRDKTRLVNYSAKLNWQAGPNDMVSAFWFLNEKEKVGRVGAAGALTHLDGTRWDQGGYYPGNPHGLSKLEWNHIFGPNLFLNAKAAYYSTGFSLEPQGGLDDSLWVLDNVNREARGTSYAEFYERPQTSGNVDGNWFLDLGGSHEVKFGVGWRSVGGSRETVYPGDQVQARFNPTSTRARFYRNRFTDAEGEYWDAYLSDTFTRDRLTVSAGLRYDLQRSRNRPTSVGPNPLIPNLLPPLDYAGDGDAWPIEWNTLSPRAGLTYALDSGRKTLVRASYAWYAGQLANSYAAVVNPLAPAYLEYDWRDLNGDQVVQVTEVDFSRLRGFANVDPLNPAAVGESPNRLDPDLTANRDHEVVLGLDRELTPNFAASLSYTWRRTSDLLTMQNTMPYWYAWVGIRTDDFDRGETVCQSGYCATPYVLDSAALLRDEVTGGQYFTNRQDYGWRYNGLELGLTKRMSDRWMGRVAVTWADWQEEVGPLATAMSNPTRKETDPLDDGGQVVYYSAGTSGKVYYQNAKWQVAANALYQLPAGFEIAANVFGRQGYPNPVYLSLDLGELDGEQRVLADGVDVDQERFPALWDVDLRLAKNIKLGDRLQLVLSGEMFNVFNSGTEMTRVSQANSTSFGRIDEILAPRIVRFGARVTF